MAYVNELVGECIIDKKRKLIDVKTHCEGKTVGFYFSANWCPPCRGFTPELITFYNTYSESKNFEIIFVSADRTQISFNDYFETMPWLALEYQYNKKMVSIIKYLNTDS